VRGNWFGGVYRGAPIQSGVSTPRVLLESLFPSLSSRHAPVLEEALRINGAKVVFRRPTMVSGVVFLDISVSVREGARSL
jgi:hypothetical protein